MFFIKINIWILYIHVFPLFIGCLLVVAVFNILLAHSVTLEETDRLCADWHSCRPLGSVLEVFLDSVVSKPASQNLGASVAA